LIKWGNTTRLRLILRYLLMVIAGAVFLVFLFRTPVTSWYLHRRIDRFNRENQACLTVAGVKVKGLASILVTGITLKPEHGDTLLKVDSAYATFSILKLLAGRIALHHMQLINTGFFPESHDSLSNFGFLLHGGKKPAGSDLLPVNYAEAADRFMRFVFDKIPLSLEIRNFSLTGIAGEHKVVFHLDRFALLDHYFRSVAEITEDSAQAKWVMAGKIDNGNRLAEFRLYPAGTAKLVIPYLRYRWNALVGFDTLAFSIAGRRVGEELSQLSGFVRVSGLRIDHRKIAAGEIGFDKAAISYQLNIGKDYAELDSTTRVNFNRIDFHPYMKVRLLPRKQVTLKISKPQFPAQDLFSSFPKGLFINLDGIRVKGNLSWYLDFFVDLTAPDSLRFETSLDRHQFAVLSYGNANLTKINDTFSYTAYDNDRVVRTFMVGPGNPNFRTLDHISPYLQYAVLTSEDGSFYQHRGFLPDAFRESIATNIREHRFARGGSTISMQLVKNVFLSRNKTVGRKLEEALIVWLIENQGLSTKERMYEVYLNLIEWGPLVYGANEGARFYFGKDASRLTLAEAIFMASVIPRPRWFKYSFNPDGHLRESNAGFFRLVSEKMVNKGWITPLEAGQLVPDVELKGPARLMLKQRDSIPPDTLDLQNPD